MVSAPIYFYWKRRHPLITIDKTGRTIAFAIGELGTAAGLLVVSYYFIVFMVEINRSITSQYVVIPNLLFSALLAFSMVTFKSEISNSSSP